MAGISRPKGVIRAAEMASAFARGGTPSQRMMQKMLSKNLRPPGIPKGWRSKSTKSSGGVLWSAPGNKGITIRFMPGKQDAKFARSRTPYVRIDNAAGQPLDKYGKVLPSAQLPEAHIPFAEYDPSVFRRIR